MSVSRAKYVRGNTKWNDCSWRDQGYDACRADGTSASSNMEWCIRDRSQVQVIRISEVTAAGSLRKSTPAAPRSILKRSRSESESPYDAPQLGGDDHDEDQDELVLKDRLQVLDDEAASVAAERALVLRSLAVFDRRREQAAAEERRRKEQLAAEEQRQKDAAAMETRRWNNSGWKK